MFTHTDQHTLDIDWFLTNGNEIAFMTSAGSILPPSVAKSKSNNEILRKYFNDLPFICEFIVNPFFEIATKSRIDEVSYSDFLSMARKGLYAFDKTNAGAFSDPGYHLVAAPEIPLRLTTLPREIKDILLQTSVKGEMGLTFDIRDVL